jgi:hypothetical protein
MGRLLDDGSIDSFWICLSMNAIARDGHDVMDDKGAFTKAWRITSQSPPPGALVPENQTITFTVAA